jgi:hypothetical protein
MKRHALLENGSVPFAITPLVGSNQHFLSTFPLGKTWQKSLHGCIQTRWYTVPVGTKKKMMIAG